MPGVIPKGLAPVAFRQYGRANGGAPWDASRVPGATSHPRGIDANHGVDSTAYFNATPVLGRATACRWGGEGRVTAPASAAALVAAGNGAAARGGGGAHTLKNPYNGFAYTRAPLSLNGTVYGLQRSGTVGGYDQKTTCAGVSQALVEVWQADAYGRFDQPPLTALAQAHLDAGTLAEDEAYLEPGQCRAALYADANGAFQVDTEVPGAYGPPQHLFLRVSAPGYVSVTTAVYLKDDPYLQYLAPRNFKQGLAKEPRVVGWRTSDTTNRRQGSDAAAAAENLPYVVNFDVTLEPSESRHDLSGTWVDDVGRILVESDGITLTMTEVPKPRRWGATTGLLAGDTVRFVDFRGGGADGNIGGAQDGSDDRGLSLRAASGAVMVTGGGRGGEAGVLSIAWDDPRLQQWVKEPRPLRFRFLRLTVTETTRSAHGGGLGDPHHVSGGLGATHATQHQGSFGHPEGAYVNLNELVFYEGTAKRDRHPKYPMVDAHTPEPLVVTCSGQQSGNTPCWKAFDGVESEHGNRWRSEDVSRRLRAADGRSTTSTLNEAQWIMVDFGEFSPENWILPTAMKIVCDPGDAPENLEGPGIDHNAGRTWREGVPGSGVARGSRATPNAEFQDFDGFANRKGHSKSGRKYRDCPMAFVLEGSTDGSHFQNLYQRGGVGDWVTHDMYPASGKVFDFAYAPPTGRANGDACGSCDSGDVRGSGCKLDTVDATCESSYCNVSRGRRVDR